MRTGEQRHRLGTGILAVCALWFCHSMHAATTNALGRVLDTQGKVQFGVQTTNWRPAAVGQALGVGDRLRTLIRSRATLRLAELGIKRIGQLTTLEILPPRKADSAGTINLKAGSLYLFMRGRPREFLLQMPHAIGASRGTDFHVAVDGNGRSVVTVFDGEVDVSNAQGAIVVGAGEQGIVEPGQAPVLTPVLQLVNVVQWWLYYPAVLDADEIPFTNPEAVALLASIQAYRAGDLLGALEAYPEDRLSRSDAERLYYASLLLSVGQVDRAVEIMDSLVEPSPLATALERMIGAVTLKEMPGHFEPQTASGWLAESYYRQKEYQLLPALDAARNAITVSPQFGFGWTRLASLEFSFGRIKAAREALQRALALAPYNAQAWALQGFILSAENRIPEAREAFDRAIALDGALGNGWLGHGLTRIREGDLEGGRRDLQVAAALEPNRSLFRSYLGKAFGDAHDVVRARKELALAQRLDPNDPTPWLYSSLLRQEQHQMNAAVEELERSVVLNDHRQVYRSRLLLDQDRSVRNANLATIYLNVGMTNRALAESAKAVAYDYGNYSAHRFLAQSYFAIRDPTQFNLRYEAAWLNELLLASLLSPVGAGTLSRNINQHEYARLFEADGFGLSTDAQWRGDGQTTVLASQFGTFGNTSYAFDLDYQHNDGVRRNNELTRVTWFTQVKQQLTPQDSVLLMSEFFDFESGDGFQYYDGEASARPLYYSDETQDPNLVAGYHREWAPGIHTLAIAGRLDQRDELGDIAVRAGLAFRNTEDLIIGFSYVPMDVTYRNEFETYITEINQIVQWEPMTWVFGGRYHTGEFETRNLFTESAGLRLPTCPAPNFIDRVPCFADPPAYGRFTDDYERISGYSYLTVEVIEHLLATAGIAYDQVTYPSNYRYPPVFGGDSTVVAWSPKGAVLWNPVGWVTVRSAYAQTQGGVSFDQNYLLEPAQLAGFTQTFRTLMSESVVSSVSAPSFEILGGAVDVSLPTRTYLTLQGEYRESEVERDLGYFEIYNVMAPFYTTALRQEMDYFETVATASMHQLLGDAWSLGAQYQFVRSELDVDYPAIWRGLSTAPHRRKRSDLHRVSLSGIFHHPSGLFAGTEAHWFFQKNEVTYAEGRARPRQAELPGEDFPQWNAHVGYRFPRQRGDISLGILNLTDENYHLDPLNSYPEMPHERAFMTRLRLVF